MTSDPKFLCDPVGRPILEAVSKISAIYLKFFEPNAACAQLGVTKCLSLQKIDIFLKKTTKNNTIENKLKCNKGL